MCRRARLVKGDELDPKTRSAVLRRYANRHYTDYFNNDDEYWLSKNAFYVKADGSLDHRYNHCEPYYMAD